MLKRNLLLALRTLRRHKGLTAIHVVGLGVGLACCLLIALYVRSEQAYDRFHTDADHIVRVVETRRTPEGSERVATTAAPVGPALVQEVPGVRAAVRLTSLGRFVVERGDARFYVGDYLLTEPSFFDVFHFPLAQGDPRTALQAPHTVVLTSEAARRYFGSADALGQTVTVENMGEVTVTGVLAPIPASSHLQFSMLFPFATFATDSEGFTDWLDDWAPDDRIVSTYLALRPGTALEAVEAALPALFARHAPDSSPIAATLQPLPRIHLHSAGISGGYNARPGSPTYLYVFSTVALFILLIAGINYTNLATARGAERAREIGVRKAVGAARSQLVRQHLVESFVLCGLGLAFALGLSAAVLPAFSQLAGRTFTPASLAAPAVVAPLLLGVLALGALAGGYPALVLAGFSPVRALKGLAGTGKGTARLRRGLVVTQFALSIALIVATLVVGRQLAYVRSAALGFQQDGLVVIDINSGSVRRSIDAVRADMLASPYVERVAVSSRVPGDWKDLTEIEVGREGAAADARLTATAIGADDQFLSTYGMRLTAGRTFSPSRAADTTAVLLNETAVRALGLTDPIGQTVAIPVDVEDGAETALPFTVIGVVADFHFRSLYEPIRPLVLAHVSSPLDRSDYVTARVQAAHLPEALAHLRAVGERFDPEHPFEYNLLDQRIAEVYEADQRASRLFSVAAGLAILTACLGLFGLAAFTVEQRTKEVGVRKVLGASVPGLVALLTRDFMLLVGLAFVVAAPLAYLGMARWLDSFAYRVALGPGVFLLAGAVALVVAFLTVSTQALRAAATDPVQTLRSE